MKISTRDKTTLVFLFVLAVIICAYMFGYKKFTAEKEQLEKDIAAIDLNIQTKKQQLQKKDFYIHMSNIYEERFQEELKKFPEGIEEENQIMFFKEIEEYLSENGEEFKISSVTFSTPQVVTKFVETQKLTNLKYEGIYSTVTFPFTLKYEKFKDLLDLLEEYKARNVISTITANYNEEVGYVSGSVIFSQYAITEDTRFLLQPEVEDMELGTDNIFTSPILPDGDKAELTIDMEAERIKSSFDMFLLLDPATSAHPTTTMGFLKNPSLLRDTLNDQQKIKIEINQYPVDDLTKPKYDDKGVHMTDDNGKLLYDALKKPVIDPVTGLQAKDEDGADVWEVVYEYRVTYTIGEGKGAKTIKDVLIQPNEYLDLYVYCSDRVYAEETENKLTDKASVKVIIENNTTKYDTINVYVVENNIMTEAEKDAFERDEAERAEKNLPSRDYILKPRFELDKENSTVDKINLITKTEVDAFLANPDNFSEDSVEESSEESSADVEESSEAVVDSSSESSVAA